MLHLLLRRIARHCDQFHSSWRDTSIREQGLDRPSEPLNDDAHFIKVHNDELEELLVVPFSEHFLDSCYRHVFHLNVLYFVAELFLTHAFQVGVTDEENLSVRKHLL